MADRRADPVSVILPTLEWGQACEQLVSQLRPGDELLVVCDSESDPVATRDVPRGVRVLVAGEPEGCSGKANAVAHAMEQANNDQFVWTDDDFHRDSDWLDRLVAAGETHGPATVIPFFVGGGWFRFVEPILLLSGTATIFFGVGTWGGNAWGGGVTFTRDDVVVSDLVSDLRRSLSDDGVLSEHVGYTHPVRTMRATVRVPGDFHSVKERMIRLARIPHVHEGFEYRLLFSLLIVGIAVTFPLYTAAVATTITGGMYALLRFRRASFLLGYPMLFLMPVIFASGIFLKEFEWAGRRYRVHDVGDIDVVTGR